MIKTEDTALILIDVQGKLVSAMHERGQLVRNLQTLVRGAKILDIPIFWLEQYPEGLGPTIPEIADLLAGQEPVSKTCFSACGEDRFLEALRSGGRRQLLLAGIETHVCVYQTARDLVDQGYRVEFVVDATSSRSVDNKRVGVKKMLGAGAGMTSVETALFELLRTAGTSRFKEISRWVK